MPDPVAIQAPLCAGAAVELARDSRIFRKQVLRAGAINYQGRRLDFTPDYLDGLVSAFADQPYPMVPLVFADAENRHTQDVERIRGEVIGLERTPAGIDAIVRASNEQAARLLRENPKIGCSVRIEQPLERADGRRWDAALHHVLATANPKMPGLGDWTAVDLASDARPVIDLSALNFTDDTPAPPAPLTEEEPMADTPAPFTDEETAALRALLTQIQQGEEEPDPSGYTEPSEEELQALVAAFLSEEDTTPDAEPAAAENEPVDVAALSAEHAESIELAQTRADRMEIELAALRAERDTSRYEQLRHRLATEFHIPPRITELARPLLLGAHTVELADGGTVDAAAVMRTVLEAVGAHVKLIDLSAGSDVVYDADQAEQDKATTAARSADVQDYIRTYGL